MAELLEQLSELISANNAIAPFIALLAGFITSLTPCCLAGIPLVIGYVSNRSSSRRTALAYTLLFCLGMAVILIGLGSIAALAGRFISFNHPVFNLILGILMLFLALNAWGLIRLSPKPCGYRGVGLKGASGALLTGMLSAVFSSPCAAPALVAILLVVFRSGSIIMGITMLIMYAIGHSILIILAGTFSKAVSDWKTSPKLATIGKILNVLLGMLILAIGLYFVYYAIYALR